MTLNANPALKKARAVETAGLKPRHAQGTVCGVIGLAAVTKANVPLGRTKRGVRPVATVAVRLVIEPVMKAVDGIFGMNGGCVLAKAPVRLVLMRTRLVATAELRVAPAVSLVIGRPGRPAQAKGSVPRTPSKIRKRLAGIVVLVIANGPVVMVVSGIHGKNGPHA